MSVISQVMNYAENNKEMFCAYKVANALNLEVEQVRNALKTCIDNGGLLVAPLGCSCSEKIHKQYVFNKKPEKIQDDITDKPKSYKERILEYGNNKTSFCCHEIHSEVLPETKLETTISVINILKGERKLGTCSNKDCCKMQQKKHTFYYVTKSKTVIEKSETIKTEKQEILEMIEKLNKTIITSDQTTIDLLQPARDVLEKYYRTLSID